MKRVYPMVKDLCPSCKKPYIYNTNTDEWDECHVVESGCRTKRGAEITFAVSICKCGSIIGFVTDANTYIPQRLVISQE